MHPVHCSRFWCSRLTVLQRARGKETLVRPAACTLFVRLVARQLHPNVVAEVWDYPRTLFKQRCPGFPSVSSYFPTYYFFLCLFHFRRLFISQFCQVSNSSFLLVFRSFCLSFVFLVLSLCLSSFLRSCFCRFSCLGFVICVCPSFFIHVVFFCSSFISFFFLFVSLASF